MKIWPPWCCVTAFITASLEQLGYNVENPALIAKELGTSIGPEDDNPWNLDIQPDYELRGVSLLSAKKKIPLILKQFDERLNFRHVKFRTVTFHLFQDYLEQELKNGAVVGVGFNYTYLFGGTNLNRHITRILPADDTRIVYLIDDFSNTPPENVSINWIKLEKAVYDIDDGFWIIGNL
jgi:hypothetical protein